MKLAQPDIGWDVQHSAKNGNVKRMLAAKPAAVEAIAALEWWNGVEPI
jgi:hypothetical protein